MSGILRNRRERRRDGVRGFTLIELMVTIAIVGILVGIAVPAYSDAVRKGKRGQAKADLVELAQRAERYRTVSGGYAGFTLPSGYDVSPRPSAGGAAYTIAVVVSAAGVSPSTFTLSAVPIGNQRADTRCMTLTLTNTGVKGVTDGATGTAADCW